MSRTSRAVVLAGAGSAPELREFAVPPPPAGGLTVDCSYGGVRPVSGNASGSPLSGSWADAITLVPGTTVVTLPAGVDPLAAMAFACAGPTMVHALWERRPVRAGETVVVQGSGPVGLAAA